jgi:hypothetical protein
VHTSNQGAALELLTAHRMNVPTRLCGVASSASRTSKYQRWYSKPTVHRRFARSVSNLSCFSSLLSITESSFVIGPRMRQLLRFVYHFPEIVGVVKFSSFASLFLIIREKPRYTRAREIINVNRSKHCAFK